MHAVSALTVIASLLAVPTGTAVAATSDYDGDGRSDVFWRNTITGADVIWRSASATTMQPVVKVNTPGWQIVAEGDFNGDGRADVVWRNFSTGANVIWKSGSASTPQAVVGVT